MPRKLIIIYYFKTANEYNHLRQLTNLIFLFITYHEARTAMVILHSLLMPSNPSSFVEAASDTPVTLMPF